MPIYEYQCENGHFLEVLQKTGEPEITECTNCAGRVHRVLSSANFVLRGPGFYVNDYKKQTQSHKGSLLEDKPKPKSHETVKQSPDTTS